MALVVEAFTTSAFAESTQVTITKPTGTVNGELLIVAIAGEPGGGGFVNSVPSGWTLAKQETSDNCTYLYYKIASSEGASWVWGFDASNACGGGCLRVSGAKASGPLDQANSGLVNDDATPTFTSADIDPTTLASLFVMVAHSTDTADRTISGYAIVTNNPTWTEHFNITDGGLSSVHSSLAVATAVRAQDTASGDPSYVIDSGGGGADGRLVIANFKVESDVTVSPAVIDLTFSVQAPSITGGANVTPSVVDITVAIQAPTVTTPANDWTNQNKNTASWVNQTKN